MPMKGHPLRQCPKSPGLPRWSPRVPLESPKSPWHLLCRSSCKYDGALRLYTGISTKQEPEETGDRTLVGGEGTGKNMVVEGGAGRPYFLLEISL